MNEWQQLFLGYVVLGFAASGFFGIAALIITWFWNARKRG